MSAALGLQWRYRDGLKSHPSVRMLPFHFRDFGGQAVHMSTAPHCLPQHRAGCLAREGLARGSLSVTWEREVTALEGNRENETGTSRVHT